MTRDSSRLRRRIAPRRGPADSGPLRCSSSAVDDVDRGRSPRNLLSKLTSYRTGRMAGVPTCWPKPLAGRPRRQPRSMIAAGHGEELSPIATLRDLGRQLEGRRHVIRPFDIVHSFHAEVRDRAAARPEPESGGGPGSNCPAGSSGIQPGPTMSTRCRSVDRQPMTCASCDRYFGDSSLCECVLTKVLGHGVGTEHDHARPEGSRSCRSAASAGRGRAASRPTAGRWRA